MELQQAVALSLPQLVLQLLAVGQNFRVKLTPLHVVHRLQHPVKVGGHRRFPRKQQRQKPDALMGQLFLVLLDFSSGKQLQQMICHSSGPPVILQGLCRLQQLGIFPLYHI